MNLYQFKITDELGTVAHQFMRAENKVIALNKVLDTKSWRFKDRIANIEIIEDAGNEELTHEDYKKEK